MFCVVLFILGARAGEVGFQPRIEARFRGRRGRRRRAPQIGFVLWGAPVRRFPKRPFCKGFEDLAVQKQRPLDA
eukprot:11208482-Lingulodinium_polyedra.AAC.1